MCPFPTTPLIENKSQQELCATCQCPFYLAARIRFNATQLLFFFKTLRGTKYKKHNFLKELHNDTTASSLQKDTLGAKNCKTLFLKGVKQPNCCIGTLSKKQCKRLVFLNLSQEDC
jgi:hypothetical protein